MPTSVGTEGVRWQQESFWWVCLQKLFHRKILESKKVAHILGYLFYKVKGAKLFRQNLRLHFGRFFQKLIWSPWFTGFPTFALVRALYTYDCVVIIVPFNQGDKIGRIWGDSLLWAFLNYRSSQHFGPVFSPRVRLCINFDKKWVGLLFSFQDCLITRKLCE
jgi:hypothetical protein